VVEGSRYATERRLSAKQATRRRRQRNFQLGDVPEVQGWPNHRTHTESSKCRCVCEVEIALKTKYPWFCSSWRAARDPGTDINKIRRA